MVVKRINNQKINILRKAYHFGKTKMTENKKIFTF